MAVESIGLEMLARSEQHEERQEPQEKASNSDAPSGNEDQAEPDQLARHGTPLIGETSDDASQACVIDESGLPADSDSDGSSESDSMPTVTDELHQATVTAAANALLHGSLIGSSSDDDDEEDEYEEGSSPSESSGYESGFSSDGAEAGSDYDLANGDVAAAQRHERRTSSLTLSTTSEEVVEQLQDSTQSSESEAESQAQSDFFDDDDKISSTPCGPTQHLSLSSPSPITHRGKPVVRDASLQCLPLVHIPQPPQKDRDLYDDTVDSPADDNFSDCDFDEDDLKDFYTDDSGDDMYAGFLPQEPVVQQQEPEPNRQRKRSLSPPDTVLRRVASTSHFRPPVIGPPTRPFDTVPHPQHQVFRAPGKLIHGLSPIRAGKLRATTPPKGRWQPSFSPCDYIRDLIVTELIHLAMTDWKIVPMAVEERHGMDPRGKINLYRFLLNIRRLLNLQLTSRAWRAAVCRNAMWLGALNIMMRTQLYRYPLDPQAALRLSRWPPFFSFVAWLRERCLACLLNGVNVDIRGINGGLSILYHSTSPDASFGPVSMCEMHLQTYAQARQCGNVNLICHQCLMEGYRPSKGGNHTAGHIVPINGDLTSDVGLHQWISNECGDCRTDRFASEYEDVPPKIIPRGYELEYFDCPSYKEWIETAKSGNIKKALCGVIQDLREMAKNHSCDCGICERQKRAREEEDGGRFGVSGRKGVGNDKRLKTA